MKVAVLGPTDLEKVTDFTSATEDVMRERCRNVGELLARKGHELVITPGAGVAELVARAYKAAGGEKVVGLVPKPSDFPVSHLTPFLSLVDERVEPASWAELEFLITRISDAVIVVGLSSGVFLELGCIKYNKRYYGSPKSMMVFTDTAELPGVMVQELLAEGIAFNRVGKADELESVL